MQSLRESSSCIPEPKLNGVGVVQSHCSPLGQQQHKTATAASPFLFGDIPVTISKAGFSLRYHSHV